MFFSTFATAGKECPMTNGDIPKGGKKKKDYGYRIRNEHHQDKKGTV